MRNLQLRTSGGNAMRAQYFSVSRARLLQESCARLTQPVFAQVSKAPQLLLSSCLLPLNPFGIAFAGA